MTDPTLRVNCDQNCTWRDGLAELKASRSQERAALPRDESLPVDGAGNHPLTAEGYEVFGKIESAYRGLDLLAHISCQTCFTPCAIADYVAARLPDPDDKHPIQPFGNKVLALVNSIEGV